MQFIYKIQPIRENLLKDGPTEEESRIIGDHFNYLQDLHKKGVVKLAGRTLTEDSSSFGIVIFYAKSEQEAIKITKGDPAITKDVMKYELFPFSIALGE